jgi:phosphodiesterase/alkaline phosphatase D-like protein
VLVIRMDLRSQKFPEKSSVMSACQMTWLKQQLAQCFAYDLVFLVSSFNWIGKPEAKAYGWAEFAQDRQAVANAIEANGCTDKLVLVAGDAHMLAFDDGANSNYASTGSSNSKGFPVVCPPRRMMHTP